MSSKILLTGGSGFVGKHVLKALLARKADITVLTRNSKQLDKLNTSGVTFIQHDIHSNKLISFEELGSPDIVLHLAWGGLPNYNSLHHYEKELPAHYVFLKNLIEGGLKKLIVSGTCFEYGMKSGELFEDMCADPTNAYGFAKNTLRRELEFLQTKNSFGLTWARLFYLWGEGQSTSSLYNSLCSAISSNHPEFDLSGGKQKRDYLPVEEVAEYLTKLCLDIESIGILNISSGEPVTIKQIVNTWVNQKGSNIRLNYGKYPYPDYEPMEFWGSSKKMKSAFNLLN
jgi:dTDP-6-deoxy-L-talose 4-dehydrogenase (NAD+)